jgi:hypothetical protein
MKTSPDWLRGGDPIRTEPLVETMPLAIDDLQWSRLGSWAGGGSELIAEVGRTSKGDAVAARILGQISGTARGLTGEIGWYLVSGSEVALPRVAPEEWSGPWRSWGYGELDTRGLLDSLGFGKGRDVAGKGTISFPFEDLKSRRRRFRQQCLFLMLAAMAVGVAIGWSLARVVLAKEKNFDQRTSPEARKIEDHPTERSNQDTPSELNERTAPPAN